MSSAVGSLPASMADVESIQLLISCRHRAWRWEEEARVDVVRPVCLAGPLCGWAAAAVAHFRQTFSRLCGKRFHVLASADSSTCVCMCDAVTRSIVIGELVSPSERVAQGRRKFACGQWHCVMYQRPCGDICLCAFRGLYGICKGGILSVCRYGRTLRRGIGRQRKRG